MGTIQSVSLSPVHGFSKQPQRSITLLTGLGVEGDAHCGATVQHLYLRKKNSAAPNRMQVHLLQAELLDELATSGFVIGPGDLGENILTRGLDLLALPAGTKLHIGDKAIVELTCLRQPCVQINRFRPGLQKQMYCTPESPVRYRAGVMSIVLKAGIVCPSHSIAVELPPEPHRLLTT